jgi:hypothetical protein
MHTSLGHHAWFDRFTITGIIVAVVFLVSIFMKPSYFHPSLSHRPIQYFLIVNVVFLSYSLSFICNQVLSNSFAGGNFVCKLFDLFTPFSVGLVYLMYKSFQRISILKPNTSRPANSER